MLLAPKPWAGTWRASARARVADALSVTTPVYAAVIRRRCATPTARSSQAGQRIPRAAAWRHHCGLACGPEGVFAFSWHARVYRRQDQFLHRFRATTRWRKYLWRRTYIAATTCVPTRCDALTQSVGGRTQLRYSPAPLPECACRALRAFCSVRRTDGHADARRNRGDHQHLARAKDSRLTLFSATLDGGAKDNIR